jgi:hypothetical protein
MALVSFRRKHIEIVTRYIVVMANRPTPIDIKGPGNGDKDDHRKPMEEQPVSIAGAMGTGGTRPVHFLKLVRGDVVQAMGRGNIKAGCT